jgi:Raf kinase inhibitor-like YbhB/YbcL family protein
MTGRRTCAVLAAVLLAGCGGSASAPGAASSPASGGGSAGAAGNLHVSSSAFTAGATIPSRFTCHGAGEPPPLAWTGVDSAPALALVVDDPDAPGGTFVHWVVFDLPGGTTGLPQGGALPADARQASNSGGGVGWAPPCPPSGTHHYQFTVYALSAPTGLVDGADPSVAIAAIDRLATGRGQLVGLVSSQ